MEKGVFIDPPYIFRDSDTHCVYPQKYIFDRGYWVHPLFLLYSTAKSCLAEARKYERRQQPRDNEAAAWLRIRANELKLEKLLTQ